MRFVGVKELRYHPMEIIKTLAENEVIITMNGKPRAILTQIDGNQIESYIKAVRQAKAIMAINMLQENSVKAGTDNISNTEIKNEINAVRKQRRSA